MHSKILEACHWSVMRMVVFIPSHNAGDGWWGGRGERKPWRGDVCTKAWGWNDTNMLVYLVTNGCLSSSLWKNKLTKCIVIFNILFELILWGRKMVVTVKGDCQDNRASAAQERVAKGTTIACGLSAGPGTHRTWTPSPAPETSQGNTHQQWKPQFLES